MRRGKRLFKSLNMFLEKYQIEFETIFFGLSQHVCENTYVQSYLMLLDSLNQIFIQKPPLDIFIYVL